MFDVVSVGSATLDVFIKSDLSKLIRVSDVLAEKSYLCYDYGSKVNVENIEFLTGGGATNTGISFARLGLKAAFLGKVAADDDAATKVLSDLKAEGVDTSYAVRSHSLPTGYSVILVSYEGDRTVLTFRGANNTLDETDVDWSLLDNTKWLYMSGLSGRSAQIAHTIAFRARDKGVKLAFNPGSTQLKTRIRGLRSILETTEILLLNREEAETLTGVDAKRQWVVEEKCGMCGKCVEACEYGIFRESQGRISVREVGACRICGECITACPTGAIRPEPWTLNMFDIFRKLFETGVKIVAITDGGAGAQVSDGQDVYIFPAYSAPVVDTLGAGDAFASAFVAEYVRSGDIAKGLRVGSANASSVVRYFGAKQGLLTLEEAEDIMKDHDERESGDTKVHFIRKFPLEELVPK